MLKVESAAVWVVVESWLVPESKRLLKARGEGSVPVMVGFVIR